MPDYDFKKIEKKWVKKWLEDKIYEPDLDLPRHGRGKSKKPFYNLTMFPYPSAEGLHVGNMYDMVGCDIYGRKKRMEGFDVFQPIGLDGFGIHSENYALKINKHPKELSKITEKRFYEQIKTIGAGFSWDERLETYDPEYYKWTQWIFVQMFKKGLAYRKKATVNWCPKCLTVLADEQVFSGECERCSTAVIKKELEQWFFKITDYAERLLNDLVGIDWSKRVKIAQKNWIGKSEGASIRFPLAGIPGQLDGRHYVEVFTTRPDTLFGATFIAVSPELAKFWLEIGWQAPDKVKKYIEEVLARRGENNTDKGKTGIDSGVFAINPANQEKIPVWIADYVLSGYGTGAIMAVPAHDERDMEFAKKFGLSIIQVITPARDTVSGVGIIIESNTGKLLLQERDQQTTRYPGMIAPFGGAIEEGETSVASAVRELREEINYSVYEKDLDSLGFFESHFESDKWIEIFYVRNVSLEKLNLREGKKVIEISAEEAIQDKRVTDFTKGALKLFLKTKGAAFAGSGVITNSGEFDGMDSEKAKWEITKFVGGKKEFRYHLRDWLISRQRYWGPPIPMIYCDKCGWQPVPEKDLPVLLPDVKNFHPTGTDKSPLATVESFVKTKCPNCGGEARRETDVSDTFLDSAWYFFRYVDHENKKEPFGKSRASRWLPVDLYMGGAEHAVLHLLYTRFITLVFNEWGLVDFSDPFKKFRAHGHITKDGAKMSKSRGNVVNPDEYIKKFGADVLRMYLMFLGPFEQGGDFGDESIAGIDRFLNRVYKFVSWFASAGAVMMGAVPINQADPNKIVHKTIKKVTEDIENLQYNTAIAALMGLLNEFNTNNYWVKREHAEMFLKLLAPFAPFLAEELWHELGEKGSIHKSKWPEVDASKIKEETKIVVVQINGKVRDKFEVGVDIGEKELEEKALGLKKIQDMLCGKKPEKIIVAKNRLVNIVLAK